MFRHNFDFSFFQKKGKKEKNAIKLYMVNKYSFFPFSLFRDENPAGVRIALLMTYFL